MGTPLDVGDKAPNFRLQRDDGDTVSLADFKGRKLVLLSRGQDGRGAAQDRPAHAESKGMRSLGTGNIQDDVNCPK